jgi:putative ABC transport system permease protein
VQATALAGGEPMQSTGTMIVVESAADSSPTLVSSFSAGPGYFEVLNIPILVGRAIDERDGPAATRVAVVSETMARRHFGGIDAIGRRFRQENDQAWIEIVGVVRDTATADRAEAIIDPEPEQIYLASSQWDQPLDIVIARSSLDAASLVAALQRELRAIDPGLPVIQAKTMERHLEDSLFLISLIATFLGLLGALGLVLAGTGLYAVVAFAVARRSREIGIRMALGAQRQQVAGAVVREMAGLVGAGTGVGLLLALLAILGMRQLSLSVPGAVFVPEPDPIVLLVIAAFMTIVGAMAAYVPARRAARMNPLVALRRD